MSTPAPPAVVAAFTFGGTVDVDYTIIPVPSQISVSPELASFTTGFPPATRTARNAGGIPPRGLDMNGILYMVSAHTAWASAGGQYQFNADVVTIQGGYGLGAVLQSASDPTRFYLNVLADNVNDPDSVGTGWKAFSPMSTPVGSQSANVGAGSQVVALEDSAGFLDLTPNVGATTLTNLTGGSIGQIVTVTNLHASNPLTIQSNANIRMSGDLTLLQNNSISLRRRTVTQWVAMS
jgi:hypothetical protein